MVSLILGKALLCLLVEQRTLNARRQLLRRRPEFSAYLENQVQAKRDGVWTSVAAVDLVCGDVILLDEDSVVPAECRLTFASKRLCGDTWMDEKGEGDVCCL